MSNVYAIGISPSKEVVFFEPGATKNVQFYVVNRDELPITASVSVNGEFSDLINLDSSPFILSPGEKKYIDITLTLPNEIASPGDHELRVIAQEIGSGDFGNATVGATAAVIGRLILRVPREGTFLGASLSANSVSIGEDVTFRVGLESLGTLNINNLEGTIFIYNSKNESVDTVKFSDNLAAGETKSLDIPWDSSNAVADEYSAKLVVDYSGKVAEASTKFKLGDVVVKILSFDKQIISGKITEYQTTVESGWNNPIDNVFVKLQIDYDGQGYNYKSESFSLDAFKSNSVKMFIDARELEPGVYPAIIGVYYEGLSSEEEFQIEFKQGINYILIGGLSVLVVVILILIGYLIFVRRKKSKSKKR